MIGGVCAHARATRASLTATADPGALPVPVPGHDPLRTPDVRATNGHVRLRHLPASTIGANGRHAKPEVSGDIRSGPPLRPWVRVIAHIAKLRQVQVVMRGTTARRVSGSKLPRFPWSPGLTRRAAVVQQRPLRADPAAAAVAHPHRRRAPQLRLAISESRRRSPWLRLIRSHGHAEDQYEHPRPARAHDLRRRGTGRHQRVRMAHRGRQDHAHRTRSCRAAPLRGRAWH
jgi:hypothetical protein